MIFSYAAGAWVTPEGIREAAICVRDGSIAAVLSPSEIPSGAKGSMILAA